MRRKNGIPAILYPLPKIVKNIKTIGYSGGTSLTRKKHRHNFGKETIPNSSLDVLAFPLFPTPQPVNINHCAETAGHELRRHETKNPKK